MSEPRTIARDVEEVLPGVFHWHVADDRIGGFLSAAHAWRGPDGTVLVDPLPLERELLDALGPFAAIVVTAGTHQRSAWRYRRELGLPVWMPAPAREIDEEPDRRYGDGDVLPGGLRAVFTPGAGTTQHTLLLEQPSVAFVADLLVRPAGERVSVIPAEFAHDVDQARRSLRTLVERESFDALCLAHGTPVREDAAAAIRDALER